MEITRLRVSGFKSFSEPVELQLEPGLTGIVGPNGCGKSNIVEALRWAMGESSAKGLRGDGMEDVIFNGSAGRPAHDVAEVRLKLRGRPEGLAGFDEEGELEVARRIGRGTGSAYRINGREARARDVQMLFADAGAGSRSPAIIGQGQIGFIVDSRPIDRRRLLEDAAGIGGLQARRREAELRLEATRANLQRVLDLLAHPGDAAGRAGQAGPAGAALPQARGRAAQHRGPAAAGAPCRRRAGGRRRQRRPWPQAAAEQERRAEAAASLRRARAEAAARLPALREAAAEQQAEAAALRERLASLREAAGREAAHLAALTRQRDEADADLARARAQQPSSSARAWPRCAPRHDALARSHAALAGRRLGDAGRGRWPGRSRACRGAGGAARRFVARAAEAAAQLDAARERLDELRRRQDAIGRELAGLAGRRPGPGVAGSCRSRPVAARGGFERRRATGWRRARPSWQRSARPAMRNARPMLAAERAVAAGASAAWPRPSSAARDARGGAARWPSGARRWSEAAAGWPSAQAAHARRARPARAQRRRCRRGGRGRPSWRRPS